MLRKTLPSLRLLSTHSQPHRPFHRARTVARYTGYLALSSVFGVFVVGAGIFVHDAFTYTEKHVDRVPVSPLALHPERGGPKNLPVVRVQVDDEQDEENVKLAEKPKLVIVGGGWGVCCFICFSQPVSEHQQRPWVSSRPSTSETIMSQSFLQKLSLHSLPSFRVCHILTYSDN